MSIMLTNDMLASLIGREVEPVYGHEAIQLVRDKRILVTGAGGSIGSEIVRQLMSLGVDVDHLFFLDNDEYALYTLSMSLEGSAMLNDTRYILASVWNRSKIQQVFNAIRPDIVFHAAACKHLPLLETSPEAGILTNTMGTDVVSEACALFGVQYFVNISTDKAASPTSVLGMTKRVAEIITAHRNGVTKTSSVRFGNVLGSRGSYLETLTYQMSHGMMTYVVHPEVSRYFMTIPEASGLVIEAATMAGGGGTFVLDMGESIKIVELIERFAAVMGMPAPRIGFSQLRPGEKLHEELFDSTETRTSTCHPRINAVQVDTGLDFEKIQMLYLLAQNGEQSGVLRAHLSQLAVAADTVPTMQGA